MSFNFAKTAFVSGVFALPVPLILPYLVDQATKSTTMQALLKQDGSVVYYLITWAAILLVSVISARVSLATPSEAPSKSKKSADTSDSSGPVGKDKGTVKWFNVNKGFGFITTESGEDIFVHFRSIRGRGRRSLRQGQSVRFDITEGDKGLQAENVSVVNA